MIKPSQQLANACQYLADNDVEITDLITWRADTTQYELSISWKDFERLLAGKRVKQWCDRMECMSYRYSGSITLITMRLPPLAEQRTTILGG